MLKLLLTTMVCPNNSNACAVGMPITWSLEPDVEAGTSRGYHPQCFARIQFNPKRKIYRSFILLKIPRYRSMLIDAGVVIRQSCHSHSYCRLVYAPSIPIPRRRT